MLLDLGRSPTRRAGVFGLLVLALAVAGCGSEPPPMKAGTPPPGPAATRLAGLEKVTVALKPNKNPERMLAEKDALEGVLSQIIGLPVEVIVPLSGAVIREGFANGTLDLGYVSSTELVPMREKGVADLLLAGRIDGKTSYESVWLALKDKPYATVADLEGRPIAFASRTSTSGFVVPYADLVAKGLLKEGEPPEAFFGEGQVFYGTGYTSAVEKVLTGEAEAAAVSDYVIEKDEHLKPEQKERLKVVQSQGPVPTHVVAVRSSLGEPQRAALKAALLALNAPARQDLRDKVFTSELVEVDADAHLGPIAAALARAAKVQP